MKTTCKSPEDPNEATLLGRRPLLGQGAMRTFFIPHDIWNAFTDECHLLFLEERKTTPRPKIVSKSHGVREALCHWVASSRIRRGEGARTKERWEAAWDAEASAAEEAVKSQPCPECGHGLYVSHYKNDEAPWPHSAIWMCWERGTGRGPKHPCGCCYGNPAADEPTNPPREKEKMETEGKRNEN